MVLSNFIQSISDGICLVDCSLKISSVNQSCLQLLRLIENKLVGQSFFKVVSVFDEAGDNITHNIQAAIDECLAQKKTNWALHFKHVFLRPPNGNSFMTTLSINPLWEGNLLNSLALIFREITLQNHSELKKIETPIKPSEHIGSINTLAAGLAHEINNPLVPIIANLELIKNKLHGFDESLKIQINVGELQEALSEANEGVERVRQISRDLKTLTKLENETPTLLNIEAVLDKTLQLMSNDIRSRAKLVKRYGNVPNVIAIESRLIQIFLNLTINAVHAISEGNADKNEIIFTTRMENENRVAIDVTDSGIGMPPETIQRIFTPYNTIKPIDKGTGMGLSICHKLASSMNGTMTVQSEKGKGTTFTLSLDAKHEENLTPQKVSTSRLLKSERPGKILVIDDDKSIGTTMQKILTPHQITICLSGEKGLEVLSRHEKFDVIICDVMMPGMTGIDFYNEVLKRYPDEANKLFFLTGGAFTPETQAFLANFSDRVIEKPFDSVVLQSIVNLLINIRTFEKISSSQKEVC
jgi:signal transduction histidine kinase